VAQDVYRQLNSPLSAPRNAKKNVVDSTPESLYTGLKTALETIWDRKQIRAHVESPTWFAVAEEIRAVFCDVLRKNVRSLRDHQSKTNT
jgi:hypothetical protein